MLTVSLPNLPPSTYIVLSIVKSLSNTLEHLVFHSITNYRAGIIPLL